MPYTFLDEVSWSIWEPSMSMHNSYIVFNELITAEWYELLITALLHHTVMDKNAINKSDHSVGEDNTIEHNW